MQVPAQNPTDTAIALDNVSVTYRLPGADILAVSGVSLTVQPGEFVALLGPSGCGKSTLLHVIAGFIKPSTGTLSIHAPAQDITDLKTAFVFQEFALFPWYTVSQNIGFSLKVRGRPQEEIDATVDRLAHQVGLTGFANAYPHNLSGGMQQRAGLARALATGASILLMDEPFGSLDAQTRFLMQEMLLRIVAEQNKTVVFVTHDIAEAVFLADRAIVLSERPGTISQSMPIDLPRPRTRDVIGSLNYENVRRQLMAQLF